MRTCRALFWSAGAALLLAVMSPTVRAGDIPDWLPHYDLGIHLNVEQRKVTVHERVTWTNYHARPADELVFNAYSRYKIPSEDVVLLAKTLELLRSQPSEGMDNEGRRLKIHAITLGGQNLPFHYSEENQTALVVPLPAPVRQGESITVDIEFTLDLPEKQGRWGHWNGVTFLANWYPILAFYDDHGWQPTPYIGWHQPFFNEAGVYTVRLTLPKDQKIASTGSIHAEEEAEDGCKTVHIVGCCAREFALVCSNRFQEFCAQAETAKIRVLAFPEHEHLARKALEIACEVIPIYNRWFGTYPYDEFDIVESHFPWNGNECSGMVMIDARVFSMPHMGEVYVDHLVSHEILHQWWYNVVGTNGYCETWMDEGVASFFTARRLQQKYGRNAPMLRFPKGMHWMPNIHHEDYRFNGLYGTLKRKEETATVQPMPGFGNLVTLFSMTYDRGAKILEMIETRMGEAAFLDFMRLVYAKYQFRILRVADFQRELEQYTGRSWAEFFRDWLYGAGMTDWAVDGVKLDRLDKSERGASAPCSSKQSSYRAVITLRQKAEFTEPTVVGVRFKEGGPCEMRIPVCPGAPPVDSDEPPAHVETQPDGTIRVELFLPTKPCQISVDPDQVLPDREPANNHWKPEVAFRLTPLMTPLDETDITNPYDRWSITAGPWLGMNGPWFGRHGYTGLRAGAYRLQQFQGGVYTAYNIMDEDLVLGSDALLMHFPFPQTQIGFQFDHSLTPDWAETRRDRGRLFGRYIIHYTPSMYLDPIEFVEVYSRIENEFWRDHENDKPGVERYDDLTSVGIRYHRDYLTPYWDPEAGYRFDIGYEHGLPELGGDETFNRVEGEFSYVQCLPEWLGILSHTRIAARAFAGINFPDNGEAFQLGGQNRVRGLERADREGSALWVASLEWRLPLWCDIDLDACDHLTRLRHLYAALFYDVGEIYLDSDSVDGIAHSVGAGLRLDIAIFSFIERVTVRFDVAKVVNSDEPVQFWFGFLQAF